MAELHFDSRMSDSDALMWNIEKDPLLRSTITVVTLLDRAPDRKVVNDKIERRILNRLPITLTTAIFGSMLRGVDFTTSNVPGAPVPVYLGGAQLEAMFPFGPLAGAAVNVTLLSNCGDVHLGINSDVAAIAEPDALVDCLRASFDEILAVA